MLKVLYYKKVNVYMVTEEYYMSEIRVLVVDDSALMRQVLKDIITSKSGIIVETANNGAEALKKIDQFKPQVITLDIEMPVMNGIETLKSIMKTSRIPVLMLSSLTQINAEHTIQALRLGAVDFIAKPNSSSELKEKKDEILAKITMAAFLKQNVISQATSIPEKKPSYIPPAAETVSGKTNKLSKLIIIGTSTGGPKALLDVLADIPGNINAAILIVQHMPPGFTKSLADRLNSMAPFQVKEAVDNDMIIDGWAYLAPGDFHLHVESRNIGANQVLYTRLSNKPKRDNLRPSANELFESVAQSWKGKLIAVIMTGMGNDGTDSLPAVKSQGAYIIAEDQSTCVVYGMPKAAVETGLVDIVLPRHHIAQEIVKRL